MKRVRLAAAIVGLVTYGATLATTAGAATAPTTPATVSQYAVSAVGSSDYGLQDYGTPVVNPNHEYQAVQATGAPNTLKCGDDVTAWASHLGTQVETLTLTFASPITVTEIKIWNNINPASLTKVEVQNGTGAKTTVFTRSTSDDLATGIKATGAVCNGNTVTPHDLKKATNAKALPTTPVNKVILTLDEAALYAISHSNQWAGETDAVQISGPAPAKPTFSAPATVGGVAASGKWLTAGNGTWTNSPTFVYQWFACTTAGVAAPALPAGCTPITNATNSTFQLTAAQKGKYVRVRVTGGNLGGATVSFSATTAKIS